MEYASNVKRGLNNFKIRAINWTHVRIQAPSLDYEYAFVNRKGYYSKNVQGVCDHTGNFKVI
jgi:hypothetical protein